MLHFENGFTLAIHAEILYLRWGILRGRKQFLPLKSGRKLSLRAAPNKRKQFPLARAGIAGFTCIEVIISLLLISISFIGFVRLDILSLQTHYAAYQISIASAQVISMKNRLKANGNRTIQESVLWNKENQELLPDGRGEVNCLTDGCNIHLSWHYHGKKWISAFIRKENE